MDENELKECLNKINEYCKSRDKCEECIFGHLIGVYNNGLYIYCDVTENVEEITD